MEQSLYAASESNVIEGSTDSMEITSRWARFQTSLIEP